MTNTMAKWRPLNFNAISKFRPNEFLMDWKERQDTVYDEENGYTVGQGWGAIIKLWEAMRRAHSYQVQLTVAMRIQKIERKMGIAVRPFEDLGLNIEEGEFDAEIPHTEEELVVLADNLVSTEEEEAEAEDNNPRRACIHEVHEDEDKNSEDEEDSEREDLEDPYSEAALAASYNARRACEYEIHRDDKEKDKDKNRDKDEEEKRKYCTYELK